VKDNPYFSYIRIYKICAIQVMSVYCYYCVPIGDTHKETAGRQIRYKVTLRWVLVTIVAVEKQ